MSVFKKIACFLLLTAFLPAGSYLKGAELLDMQEYTLENGLKVFLIRNTEKPKIQTYICVRAGSVNDPADSTGLAHYFEHMLFKGGPELAALDWPKEKPLLNKIEDLFEVYRRETDEAKRKTIYSEINRLSAEAAQYSNDEYWNIVRDMGATGTNAFTSKEITAYENTIPSNMLDRFLTLEAERFRDIVLRRFHTELETVYEEYNRAQDQDSRRAFSVMSRLMYPASPYGRDIIGLPEHLKNPSIKAVKEFFNTWYVPQNMAIILCGDLEFDKALASVKRTFGNLPRGKKILPPCPAPESPAKENRTAILTGPEQEFLWLTYRLPRNRENEHLLMLAGGILFNGKCGLIDKNLNLPQKAGYAGVNVWSNLQDVFLGIYAVPLPGQTLEELKGLLFAEVEKLKNGAFEEWLITAYANHQRLDLMQAAEHYGSAAELVLELYEDQSTPADLTAQLNKMEKTTRNEVADYAKENLKYYVCVEKRQGEHMPVHIEKPQITPLAMPDKLSPFAAEIAKIPAGPEPELEEKDYSKLLSKVPFSQRTLYASPNKTNELFTLTLEFYCPDWQWGTREMGFDLAELCGTEKRSAEEFNQILYQHALSLTHKHGQYKSSITITGLQKDLPKAIELLAERLKKSVYDEQVYAKYLERLKKSRNDTWMDKEDRMQNAILFALYGKENANREIPPADKIADKGKGLLNMLKKLEYLCFQAASYYGPGDPEETAKLLEKYFPGEERQAYGAQDCSGYKIQPPQEDTVYLCDYPGMLQAKVNLLIPTNRVIPANFGWGNLASLYMNPLAFSELREKKALGYLAGGYYSIPTIHPDNYSFIAFVLGTQPDKLTEGMTTMDKLLLLQMPEAFETAKANLLSRMRSTRVHPSGWYSTWQEAVWLDRRPHQKRHDYEYVADMTSERFFETLRREVSGKNKVWVIMGDLKMLDIEKLKRFGKIRILTEDEIRVR